MFVSTITSFVSGLITSCVTNLPINLSWIVSINWFPSLMSYTHNPSVVPQSWSLTIISWATSTSLLVKYPESAVLKAVSAKPFLAWCEEMKYSSASRPSANDALIGISITLPVVPAISPLIPAACLNWFKLPLAPDWTIKLIGLSGSNLSSKDLPTLVVALFQIVTTSLNLSSSVIKPLLYCFLTLATCVSASAKIFGLSSGTLTSSIEYVSPDWVEYLNPFDFTLSSNSAETDRPCTFIHLSINFPNFFLSTGKSISYWNISSGFVLSL